MKILQLSYRLPFPPKDGGAIGIYNITKAFHESGNKVTLLSFNTQKHFVEPNKIDASFKKLCQLHLVYKNTNLNPIAAFWSLLHNKSYHISRFESKKFEQKLIELLQQNQFDLIQLEGAFMGVYIDVIRKYSEAKISLRAHNVEYKIWKKLAANASFPKDIYLKILTTQLEKFEIATWKKVDVVAAINADELQLINDSTQKNNALLFPAGIFIDDFLKEKKTEEQNSLFHLGSMEWMPNVEGIDWFLKNVLPDVFAKNNQIKFYLAGRKMPQKYFDEKQDGLCVIGEVDDAKQFISDKQLMIVPLLSGGGVRIKIIEAMAMGKAIIATSQAAEGLNYTNGKNIIIADSAEEMQQAIIELLKNTEKIKELGMNAQQHIQQNFDQMKLTQEFLKTIESSKQ